MTVFLRLGLRLLLALLALSVIAAGIGWFLISRSLPDYSGEVELGGLQAEVTVIRDANAIPHIRASSARDGWFALGAVHAQDRLWQMELSRRAAQGRLSAYFGDRTVGLDRLTKTLDIYGLSRKALDHQSTETREALEAYAEGVNAWIRYVNSEARGRGAPEFFLFPDPIPPWTPVDSIAIQKMMALNLSGAARHETRRGQFFLSLTPERVADILPDYPNEAEITLPRFSELFPGLHFPEPRPRVTRLTEAEGLIHGPAPIPEFGGASNAWAVDGTRTSTGKPLLANDPHLWLQAPSLWYLAGMEFPGADGQPTRLIGGTLPGLPALLIGHNGKVGWGLTTIGMDDQDIFIEKVNPDDPGQYRTPSGWAEFAERPIRIEVADRPALTETVRATRHGPVLSHGQFGADKITPDGHVAAMAWTGLREDDRTVSALFELMRSETIEDAVAAAAGVTAPAQNLTLADETGVGIVSAGAMPVRSLASRSRGRIPAPGWVAANDWRGFEPASEKVRELRPLQGAVANANNRVTDTEFPDHLTYEWGDPYRIQRLRKELSSRAFHSRDSFVALQNDTVSEMARSVLPLIARELWWGEAAGRPDQKNAALELLRNWTGEMNQHNPEPLIFYEWMRALTRRVALDELGPLYGEIQGLRPLFIERVFRDIDGAGIWCDVNKTPGRETCAEMADAALDDALAALTSRYGSEVDGWRWGLAHVAIHRHQPLGSLGPLGPLFNIEHETSGGDYTLMRGQSPGWGERPFENVHASGLRVVFDFGDLNRSVAMISTGQSGHPFSRWYDHLADPWAQGDVIPLSMDQEESRAGAVGVMRLVPR